jgi:tetrahydromethanopterin:alpha-L-glutamate ligase
MRAGGGMRVAVIGQPGAWSSERLAQALRELGADAPVIDLAACSLELPAGRLLHAGRPLPALDGAVVKKIGDTATGWAVRERVSLLRHLEASGVPVLSRPDRLEAAVSRARMTVELAGAGLPMPETVLTESVDAAVAAVERMGGAVVKPIFTSKGRGMERLEPGPELRARLERRAADGGPLYLQAFVKHPGRDLGVAVLGGRLLGAYWRVAAPGHWMTTILSGGRYEAAELPAEVGALARRAAACFGLAFTGVDLMETPEGDWIVLEVSAFGGFRGLLAACGVDAAPLLARAALDSFAPRSGRA